MIMLLESSQFELPFLKNEALVWKVSVSYLYQDPIQAWAFGVFSIKLAMFKFLRELFDDSIYWYVPLIFISEVISEPHLMSCSSQISCYTGPKRLFSGKSRYPLSLICLLSGAFYRTNGWSFSEGTDFPIWCFCSPERKESENCCLPLGYWFQSKLELCGFLL